MEKLSSTTLKIILFVEFAENNNLPPTPPSSANKYLPEYARQFERPRFSICIFASIRPFRIYTNGGTGRERVLKFRKIN